MSVLVQCSNPICGQSSKVTTAALGKRVLCPHCQQWFVATGSTADGIITSPTPPVSAPHDNSRLPAYIGRFRVLSKLGSGGFGTVYRAYDPQLDRDVALKVPLPDSLSDPRRAERFLREARAAAQLRHPHIVPVFDAGGEAPNYYFAAAYIEGQPLSQAIGEHGMEIGQAVQIVRDLAEALAYAHEQGIVHRDVKPANVMIDRKGMAHLMDFGLAHRRESGEKLTQDGAVLGTPAYMAPERITEAAAQPHPTSDQYSLGVLLYELLTGHPPFAGPPEVVLFSALEKAPERPSHFRPNLPRDLETICLKTLSKRPQDRYATCADLAEDLRRWQEGRPIQARRLGHLERLARWTRRNRLVAGLSFCVAFLLILGTTFSTTFAFRANQREQDALAASSEAKHQQNLALQANKRTVQERDLARRRLYASDMQLAQRDWEIGAVGMTEERLQQHDFKPNEPDLRGFEWYYWHARLQSGHVTFKGHNNSVNSVSFSPDGKCIASGSNDNTVKVWDVESGNEVLTLRGHSYGITSVSFSPDGKRIASGSYDKTVKIWDAETGQETLILQGHSGIIDSVSFSPDGKRIAIAIGSKGVQLLDAETGQETANLWGHSNDIACVSFSPDSKRLASASHDSTVKVWNAETGQEMMTLRGHKANAFSVSFSPDGKRIASGSYDNTVKIWDVESGNEVLTLRGHRESVHCVSFSPDGKHIVSGSSDKTVKIWDAEKGQEALALTKYTHAYNCVSFSPDGELIKFSENRDEYDHTVEIFDTEKGQEIVRLSGLSSSIEDVVFNHNGTHIACMCSRDRSIKLWNLESRQQTRNLKGYTQYFDGSVGLAFSPDGKRFASGSDDKTVKIWDVESGNEMLTLRGHREPVRCVSFSPDGKRIISGSWDKTVKIWDVETGNEVLTLRGHSDGITSVSFSPDGKHIVSGSSDKTVKLWDAETSNEVLTLRGHRESVRSVSFSPDGKHIVSGSDDKTVKLWDAETGQETLTLKGHSKGIASVSFSPDGKRIASGSDDGTVLLWDANFDNGP